MTRATITTEQAAALVASGGGPVFLVDETGKEMQVAMVRVEFLRPLLGADISEGDVSETYAAQQAAITPIWDDPMLDEYTSDDGTPVD
ncbi:hypothetical protein [Aeoliella sp.]|uniref:hypothetical protein n=1 Tax=Aeoliella sp. TaxID=2795800 RepID=UPI003CCC4611